MVAKEVKKRAARIPALATRGRAMDETVSGSGNVGNALRSVYDETVNEDIPGEMLDLLGKLA